MVDASLERGELIVSKHTLRPECEGDPVVNDFCWAMTPPKRKTTLSPDQLAVIFCALLQILGLAPTLITVRSVSAYPLANSTSLDLPGHAGRAEAPIVPSKKWLE